jgi:hypothetical protein
MTSEVKPEVGSRIIWETDTQRWIGTITEVEPVEVDGHTERWSFTVRASTELVRH